jgi:hypothetical protein
MWYCRQASEKRVLIKAYTDHEAKDMALAAETAAADKDSKRLQV